MKGQFTVDTATLFGIEALPVEVEVDIGPGLPGISIVGLPDAAIQEARERVRSALRACEFTVPNSRIVINLAPSPLKKSGSGFDLPIALALLVATGQIEPASLDSTLVIGELSLDGSIRPIPGMLAYALSARAQNKALVCASRWKSTVEIEGLRVRPVESLRDLCKRIEEQSCQVEEGGPSEAVPDFSEVAGNETAKRALLVAATGLHGVLMVGPPGSGKTMLAKRIPSIMPPLDPLQQLETALVYSVVGVASGGIEQGIRPFRAPHHSSSIVGLVGGGSPVRPGEVSLAHNGVLFLDEMAEFGPAALQSLRQPMEDGEVMIVRADGRMWYPSRFMLVGATNPCPCGYLGDPQKKCTCRPDQISRYHTRIGGPLMDRIDICIDVGRVDPASVLHGISTLSSRDMRSHVRAGRAYAQTNSSEVRGLSGKRLFKAARPSTNATRFIERLATTHNLSGRGINRLLSVSRTIANLAESPQVEKEHVAEAISYRTQGLER